MKITRKQLRQLIKEELKVHITENTWRDTLDTVLHGNPSGTRRKTLEAQKQWKAMKKKLLAKIPQFATLTKSINGAFDALSVEEQDLLGPWEAMFSWSKEKWLKTSGGFVTPEGKAYHLNSKQLFDLHSSISDDVVALMELGLPIETGHAENELWDDIRIACLQAGCVNHMNGNAGHSKDPKRGFFDWKRLTAAASSPPARSVEK